MLEKQNSERENVNMTFSFDLIHVLVWQFYA